MGGGGRDEDRFGRRLVGSPPRPRLAPRLAAKEAALIRFVGTLICHLGSGAGCSMGGGGGGGGGGGDDTSAASRSKWAPLRRAVLGLEGEAKTMAAPLEPGERKGGSVWARFRGRKILHTRPEC